MFSVDEFCSERHWFFFRSPRCCVPVCACFLTVPCLCRWLQLCPCSECHWLFCHKKTCTPTGEYGRCTVDSRKCGCSSGNRLTGCEPTSSPDGTCAAGIAAACVASLMRRSGCVWHSNIHIALPLSHLLLLLFFFFVNQPHPHPYPHTTHMDNPYWFLTKQYSRVMFGSGVRRWCVWEMHAQPAW